MSQESKSVRRLTIAIWAMRAIVIAAMVFCFAVHFYILAVAMAFILGSMVGYSSGIEDGVEVFRSFLLGKDEDNEE
jgi:hypothetical protein